MNRTMPATRGQLIPNRSLADTTWLRVGGPADWFFQPSDEEDLARVLRDLDPLLPITPIGVGSNLIVRDGGIRGLVVRLGRSFNQVQIMGDRVIAGAGALDSHVARKAATAGLDLTFLRTIPGTIGGAIRTNAGCYGRYIADHLVEVTAMNRGGDRVILAPEQLNFGYRHSEFPDSWVITSVTLEAPRGNPDELATRMEAQLKYRNETQPTRDRTAGSTFRNPAGFSSTGQSDDTHELKAWKLIDEAGFRGTILGGAQMNPKHPNFLTNTGAATAHELETLGETVRNTIFEKTGIKLEWEIIRLGDPATT